jgi:hypothetical protein
LAIERDSRSPGAHQLAAEAHLSLAGSSLGAERRRHIEQGLSSSERGLVLDRSHGRLWATRSALLAMAARPAEALEARQRALAINPLLLR